MRRTLLPIVIVMGLLWPSGAALASGKPFNRVVVLVDASGSYAGRQPEAIGAVARLLGAMAQTELRRWEAGDEIVIVALDALPEVIWRGTARKRGEEERQRWMERFKARRDFAGCTDVVAGFRVAVRELGRDPAPAARYLLAFTDLKHEPPASSPGVCRPAAPPGPPPGLPWQSLRKVSVAAFWVPAAQKLAWRRAVEDLGDDLQVALYAESESAAVSVPAPPRARRVESEDQKRQRREDVKRAAWAIGGWLVTIAIAVIGAVAVLGVAALVRSQVARRRAPGARRTLA